MKNIFLIPIGLIALTTFKAEAQKIDTAKVLVSGGNAVLTYPPVNNNNNSYTISRSVGNKQNYVQLAVLKREASLSEFRAIAGDTLIQGIKQLRKVSSDNDLWKFINSNPPFSDFSLAMFNLRFLRAMGFAYVDTNINTLPKNTRIYYKITDAYGKTDTGSCVTGKQPNAIKPMLVQSSSTDTNVMIKWAFKAPANISLPHYANVYQKDQAGVFEEKPFRILSEVKKDSLYFLLSKKVKPGMEYTFYIQPVDIYNNPIAVHSDTVSLMSVNLQKMMPVEKATAKDTTFGVLLYWKKIPVNPLYSGVLIQRSSTANGTFTTVATAPLTDSTFLDKSVEVGKSYFYRMKVINQKQKFGSNFSAFVSSPHNDKHTRPDAPYGIELSAGKNGIILSWQAAKENQRLAGYRVYRSAHPDTVQMEEVSRLIINTTFTDTTKNRSRRTSYTYAIKAVSIGGVESKYSSTIQAKLNGGLDVPLTPAYINTHLKDNTLTIQWQNTKLDDNYITGYNIYRKKIVPGEQLIYDVKKNGATEASRMGFVKINKKMIDRPYYVDTLDKEGTHYEYAVTANDMTGGESGLTALAIDNTPPVKIASPVKLVLLNMDNKIQLNWQQADERNVLGYSIYRKIAGEKTYQKIASINAAQNTYSDNSFQPHHAYIYQVRAVDNNGESAGFASQSLWVN